MITTSVSVDERAIEDIKSRLGSMEKKAPQVIANSLNRAMSSVAKAVNEELRKNYHIKTADIKPTITRTRAKRSDVNAVLKSSGPVVPLDRFKVSPKTVNPKRKSPIKVAVKKGAAKPLEGAFNADINGVKVFKRSTKRRLPIDRLFGPSVPQMLNREDIRNRIDVTGQKMFNKRIDHEIERILAKGAPI